MSGGAALYYSHHSFPRGKIVLWNSTQIYSQASIPTFGFWNIQSLDLGPHTSDNISSPPWKHGSRISAEPLLPAGFPEGCDASHWCVLLPMLVHAFRWHWLYTFSRHCILLSWSKSHASLCPCSSLRQLWFACVFSPNPTNTSNSVTFR